MRNKVSEKLKNNNRRYMKITIAMLAAIILLILYTLSCGAMNIDSALVWDILYGKITNNKELLNSIKPNEVAVVWELRLPRILCGLFVGMGLSVAGTIFQSILINPLADPYTLGVSTGAAFGASVAIFINITTGIMVSTVFSAFLAAFITLLAVIYIAQKGGGMVSSSLIISGIIVGSILSSGISFIKMAAGENVSAIVFWLMGSLSSKTWSDVFIIVPIVTLGGITAFIFANDLNVMTMGEKTAAALGVNTNRLRFLYLILGASITAACVAISGIIGFIGLVVPHILRFWLTADNRLLIPLSALLGGLMLVIADNTSRLFFTSEIPVGVLTTLLGGPFLYIYLLKKGGSFSLWMRKQH